jgi:hypothetical protein
MRHDTESTVPSYLLHYADEIAKWRREALAYRVAHPVPARFRGGALRPARGAAGSR